MLPYKHKNTNIEFKLHAFQVQTRVERSLFMRMGQSVRDRIYRSWQPIPAANLSNQLYSFTHSCDGVFVMFSVRFDIIPNSETIGELFGAFGNDFIMASITNCRLSFTIIIRFNYAKKMISGGFLKKKP